VVRYKSCHFLKEKLLKKVVDKENQKCYYIKVAENNRQQNEP